MTSSLVQGLAAIAERRPDAAALGWRGTQWTYREVFDCVSATAATLKAAGLPEGARVALLIRNSPQYVALYYGVLAAGAVAVPLNAQERSRVLARQIEHCGATALVGDPAHPEWAELCKSVAASLIHTIEIPVEPGAEASARYREALDASPAFDLSDADPDSLASIIYTSGTTGRPKGVMLSHRNLTANADAIIEYLRLSPEDRGLCVLPFHFSYGNSVLHTHLRVGAYLALEDNFAFPQATLQRLQDEAITGFAGVPSTFALLLGRCRLSDFDLHRLRYITQAGGPMPRPLIERLQQQAPSIEVFIMYGQTEATARLTYLPPQNLTAKLGSIGIPIPGVEIAVFREDERAAPGVTGELRARGPNIMLGYWNDSAATAAALRDGWLHTGDLGHTDSDGYLYIDGRAVDMIKVGAFRVSPQEIEEVIAALDGVEEVAVTGIPDETLGQSIKAVIVRKPDAQLELLAVKAHCRQQLATYKVPKVVEFVATLPRTSSGKVQRFKLAEETHS